jgi:hypothetical protein
MNDELDFTTATIRLRQAVEYAKYKAWDSKVGDEKAQSIMNDFHNGDYGDLSGMWVQVNRAIELFEKTFLQ